MADKSKDTGTGGIDIDGQTFTMDVGVPDEIGGAQGEYSSGDISVDNSAKDLSRPTRETFAKYLSKTTLGAAGSSPRKNVYPVGSGDATILEESSLKDESGNPTRPGPQNNESKFDQGFNQTISSNNPAGIKRGAADGSAPDGNTLLKDAAEPAPSGSPDTPKSPGGFFTENLSPTIDKYVSSVLRNNRFTSTNRFTGEDATTDQLLNSAYKLGSPAEFSDEQPGDARAILNKNASFVRPSELVMGAYAGNDDEKQRTYDYKRLTRIGNVLQLRATGEIQALVNPGLNPRSNLAQLAALAPGAGQLGAGVPLSSTLLDVESLIEDLSSVDDTSAFNGTLFDVNRKFEGVINNMFDKFSGFSSLGMLAMSAALSVTITGVFEVLGRALETTLTLSGEEQEQLKYYRYGIGTSTGERGQFAGNVVQDVIDIFQRGGEIFGLKTTLRPFKKAVSDGLKSFFDLKKIAADPGYRVVTARAVVRSALQISLLFKDLVELFATGNIFSGVERAFDIVYAIRGSKFIAALNIFAQLGDNAGLYLDPSNSEGDLVIANNVTKTVDAGRRISSIDAAADLLAPEGAKTSRVNLDARYGKSRLQNGESPQLAWSTRQAPSAHLIPSNNAEILSKLLGGISGGGSSIFPSQLQDPQLADRGEVRMRLKKGGDSLPRLANDEVKEIEGILDGEYVPFYFHDLRTNEIIGFHAFLTSLTDDYSASYETIDGYGRVEPIRIYKGTQRKIGLSFMVAALDPTDFDAMWFKINQLLMMIYPQYTAGKSISIGEGTTFVKPFTQQIGASPMIRLRVGNLFASNYSRFNLAGVFGLFDGGAALAGRDIAGTGPEEREKQSKKMKLDESAVAAKKLATAAEDASTSVSKSGGRVPGYNWKLKAIPIKFGRQQKTTNVYNDYSLVAEVVRVVQVDGKDEYLVKFNKYIPSDPNPEVTKTAEKKYNKYKALVAQQTIDDLENAAGSVWIKGGSLGEMTTESAALFAAKKEEAEYAKNIEDFMKPAKNAIVRSFESVGGKGLAGFIESMSFDWYSGVTWDTEDERKAPKMCKVTISFAPVHDISPGLDSSGRNRAPVYRLGAAKF